FNAPCDEPGEANNTRTRCRSRLLGPGAASVRGRLLRPTRRFPSPGALRRGTDRGLAARRAAVAPDRCRAGRDTGPLMPIPVLIDCDPGYDDVIAIMLALARPGGEVPGYQTVGGN